MRLDTVGLVIGATVVGLIVVVVERTTGFAWWAILGGWLLVGATIALIQIRRYLRARDRRGSIEELLRPYGHQTDVADSTVRVVPREETE